MATFITSKLVGEQINIYAQTSTGYWKYNHDGLYSEIFTDWGQGTLTNANGEFTLISCDSDGNISGDVTYLYLSDIPLTSFDGTGLVSLANLYLNNTSLTSFDGTGLTSLTNLGLYNNSLTSLDVSGLTSLTYLDLGNNSLTSLDGFLYPTSLTYLYLYENSLTSLDVTELTSLTELDLGNNSLTSLDGFLYPTSLTYLGLYNNSLTSLDVTGLTSLTGLDLSVNSLTSLDVSGLTSLTYLGLASNSLTSLDGFLFPTSLNELYLNDNLLTSLDVTGLTSLTYLILNNNPLTPSANDLVLSQLLQNGSTGGYFETNNGRTSVSNNDYDSLINNLGWGLSGLDLVVNYFTSISLDSISEMIKGDVVIDYIYNFTIEPDVTALQNEYSGKLMTSMNSLENTGGNCKVITLACPPDFTDISTALVTVDIFDVIPYSVEGEPAEFLGQLATDIVRGQYYNTYNTYDVVFKMILVEFNQVDSSGNYFSPIFSKIIGVDSTLFDLTETTITTTTTTTEAPTTTTTTTIRITDYSLTFRKMGSDAKNAPLTIAEFEGNFGYLDDYVSYLLSTLAASNNRIAELESTLSGLLDRIDVIDGGSGSGVSSEK